MSDGLPTSFFHITRLKIFFSQWDSIARSGLLASLIEEMLQARVVRLGRFVDPRMGAAAAILEKALYLCLFFFFFKLVGQGPRSEDELFCSSRRTLAMEKLLQRIEAGTRLPNHFVVETNQEFFLFVFDETVVVANDSRHSQIILSCAKCDCAREKRRKSHSDAIVIACWRERPDVFPSWAKREKQRDVYQGKRILLQQVRVCVSVSPAVD